MHNILIAVLKLDLIKPSRLHKHKGCLFCLCKRAASANCSSVSDSKDNKIICSVSTPKSFEALTANRLLSVRSMRETFAKAREAKLDWLIKYRTPNQNTALVQSVKKSAVDLCLLCPPLLSCERGHPAACGELSHPCLASGTLLLCMLHLNTSTRVRTPFLFERGFAVPCYANLLRQQDRSCPEAMG